MLRFLAVAMGVAQILAMALTLMLLWALYYGKNSPGVDSLVHPSPLDDSGSKGAPAEACQLGCYHNQAAMTTTSQRIELQLEV